MKRTFVVVAGCSLFAVGCREGVAPPAPDQQQSVASAAKQSPASAYPVTIEGAQLPPEVLEGMAAFALHTAEQNAECALMPMNPSLATRRDAGLGCPVPASWNAKSPAERSSMDE